MSLTQRLAYTAQTEVTYGFEGRELIKPGPLQGFSQSAFLWAIAGSIGMLLALMIDSQARLMTPFIPVTFFLMPVIAMTVLAVAQPYIRQELPWELKKWVTRHQWIQSGAILLTGTLLLHILFR